MATVEELERRIADLEAQLAGLRQPGRYLDDRFVGLTPPTAGQVLTWDANRLKYVPTAPAGGGMKTTAVITPVSFLSIGMDMQGWGLAAPISSPYPSANRALFVPFVLPDDVTVKQLFSFNGTAVYGNIDVGIYDESGNRKISSGSTAQAGTSTLQVFNIADTALTAGRYYLAVALNSDTGQLIRWGISDVDIGRSFGMYQQASAFPLPDPATFAAYATFIIPLVGLTLEALV